MWVNAVAVFADGKRVVSGGEDNTVIIWDAETGEELDTLCKPREGCGHSEWVNSVYAVAVSADGKKVVSGSSDGTIKIWELPKIVGLTQSAQRAFDSSDLGYKLPKELQDEIFRMAEHETRQRGLLTRKEDTKRQERKDYDEELRRMELLDRRRWSGGAGAKLKQPMQQRQSKKEVLKI
jgi:hypothetical protein